MILYADQGKAVDGRSLVEFPSTNVTLTHLMAFSINSISLDEEEGGVKWESNLEYLNIKGSARAQFHIFQRSQFRRLREANMELGLPEPLVQHDTEFESHVLESLRRLTVHKGQCGPYHGVPSVVGCKVETTELLGLGVNCSLSMYKIELSNRDKTLRFMPNLER
jgi:hypothetical protein